MQCIVCKSNNIQIKYENVHDRHYNIKGSYTICECNDCHLLFIEPMMSNDELSSLYKDDYYAYGDYKQEASSKRPLKKLIKKLIKNLIGREHNPRLKRNAQILDLGCGSGEWLYRMRNKGYSVQGVELSKIAAQRGHDIAGLDIFPGELVSYTGEDGMFDYIHSNHSFEHINNPHETLDKAFKLLKRGQSK